jgi:cell division protein FtsQ
VEDEDAMAVRTEEDRRFRRARVRPATRRRRERLGWAVRAIRAAVTAGVLVGGAFVTARTVLTSPRFALQRIVVTGNQRLASGEVIALLDGLHGQNVLRADLAEWRARVLGSPWVSDAELRRVLPGTVEIAIVERDPVGIGRGDGQLYLVDARGVVIDEYGPQYADLDLPVIDGLVGAPDAVREAGAALAGRFLAALAGRPDLLARVSQLDVTDPRDLVVLLVDDPARLHLGDREFVERVQSYLELAPALRSRVPAIDYVDLRFGTRVFVRPAGDGRVAMPSWAALAADPRGLREPR